jgi:hypothetical protein
MSKPMEESLPIRLVALGRKKLFEKAINVFSDDDPKLKATSMDI